MSTLQLTITRYKIHHTNESTLRRRISQTKRSRSVNIYLCFFLMPLCVACSPVRQTLYHVMVGCRKAYYPHLP